MKERVLLNERYGAVEINDIFIITDHNKKGGQILSSLPCNIPYADIKGKHLTDFISETKPEGGYSADLEKIISSIDGISLIDTIIYKSYGSVIIRFTLEDRVYGPFLKVVKNTSSLFFELDHDKNIMFASDSFCRKTGMDNSSIYGNSIHFFTDENSVSRINSSFVSLNDYALSEIILDDVKFFFGSTSSLFTMEIVPVNGEDSIKRGFICHLLDEHSEKSSVVINRKMRSMTALANFAGAIAHDYNNALTAVLGNITLARMGAGKGSEIEELLRDAESGGIKIKKLTERLGVFTRGVKPVKEKSDIAKLLKNSASKVLPRFHGEHSIKIQENLPPVNVDCEMFTLLLTEILSNAIESADPDDGKVEIEAILAEIECEQAFKEISLVPGNYILITVMDNGCGINLKLAGDIFDPYISSKEERDGIGLALAYTIIKRHRGYISYEVVEDMGTVFKIYIPLF